MRKYLALYSLLLLIAAMNKAQSDPWADSVISFSPGMGAGFGQEHFPDNVLGPPDTAATALVPSATPQELLALGHGGSIILAFSDNVIVNLPGVDFTVFENPFYIGGDTTRPFVEAGIVAVSEDGNVWQEFPYDAASYDGLAGVTPTNGAADPTDPSVSGGDSFDLSLVGLDVARYVKITDAGDLVMDMGNSFDLDAVVAIHSSNYNGQRWETPPLPKRTGLACYPNPFNPNTTIKLETQKPQQVSIEVFSPNGRLEKLVFSGDLPAGEHHLNLAADDLPSGIHLLRVSLAAGQYLNYKIVILK